MSIPSQQAQELLEKLQALPDQRIAEINDFIDFLQQREQLEAKKEPPSLADFPVHHVGPWPNDVSLRREDLYGDDGR